ncbi:MAG: diacylglycerol kinase family protein [Cyclobacteriaceae bacterium]
MKQQRFSISKRIKSFRFAFNGLKILIKEEHNSRVHLFAAISAIIAGFSLNISTTEWLAIILSIGFIICLELINSSIENIADFVSTEKHDSIKKVKDLAAGGVLVSAVSAFIIAVVIFIPKIAALI